MYQGKFDAQVKGQQDPDQVLAQILKDREAAIAAKAAKAAAKKAGAAPAARPAAAPAARPAAAKPAAATSARPAAEKPASATVPVAAAPKTAPTAVIPRAMPTEPAKTEHSEAKPTAPAQKIDISRTLPADKPEDLVFSRAGEAKPAAPRAEQSVRPQQPRPSQPAQGFQRAQAPQTAQRPVPQQPAQKKPQPKLAQPAGKAQTKPAAVPAAKPEKSGSHMGGMIFYTIYFLFIFAFCIGIFFTLTWLRGWLLDYQAAQPDVMSQQVFDQLFTQPDWAQLYKLSGTEDTEFEGAEQYAEYMSTKVAGQELNYVETSAGLSGGKKYVVRLGKEKVAAFTLDGHSEHITDIPDYKLGKIELFIQRSESLTIRKLENHVVYVNGVPLDDSYTIQIASTVADQYLPTGTSGVRTSIQCIDGLMTVPYLVVYDETGANKVSVVYNPDSHMYEEQTSAIAIDEEERNAVFGALESYAGFMINASGSRAGVAKYFDGSSEAYKRITAMNSELWMNSDHGHSFKDREILGFTKYNDSLFSVRARLVMEAKLKDGGTRDYEVMESMFFNRKNGSWVCYDMMNLDITQPVGKVRITFNDASGNALSSEFYDTGITSLNCPLVTAPAGKVFTGWCTVTNDAAGVPSWNVVFTPDEAGYVTLSGGSLTPMTLYPLFENA